MPRKKKVEEKPQEKPQETPEIKPETPVLPVTEKKEKPASGEKLARSWYYFAGGVPLVAIGLGLAFVGNAAGNPIPIALGTIFIVGGGWLIKIGIDRYSVRYVADGTPKIKSANSMNVYKNKLVFEDVANPQGIQWKCLNDGKFYYIHAMELGSEYMSSFQLPDNEPKKKYFSPREAINCLRMEMVEKFLNYLPENNKQVSLIIMAAVVGALIIGLIAIP